MAVLELLHGDCRTVMAGLPAASVDAVVCDPPYGLSFMGKDWDHGVPGVAFWSAALRVAKPGAHLLAFGGTRTFHRLAVEIEDAGWEIRDTVMWVYGSGFPKSHDVGKGIDKAAGAEREVIGERMPPDGSRRTALRGVSVATGAPNANWLAPTTAPATEAARQWEGWGTALKPAWEPIIVARKPLMSACVNVLEVVESQLRERGVTGDIRWKPESASGAARSRKTANSGSTRPSEQSGTSANAADESGTQNSELRTASSSEPITASGARPTPSTSGHTVASRARSSAMPSSRPTAQTAPAAVRPTASSSPSTTSTAAELPTESPFTEKSTDNSEHRASLLGIESFAGIVTGLSGSRATARISRLGDGAFVWPEGLPKSVSGGSLTVAANVLAHGTGALNIDGCRVEHDEECRLMAASQANIDNPSEKHRQAGRRTATLELKPGGRWPANLIHDGSDEVLAGFPQSKSNDPGTTHVKANGWGHSAERRNTGYAGDTGSAARFFYCAKASKADRDEGCEGMEARHAPHGNYEGRDMDNPKNHLGGMQGTQARNHHPTVKPTELMKFLCRLITPPAGTVLDPFMGSGSTGKAAVLEGFGFIGIEQDAEYIAIARARIAHAVQSPAQQPLHI